MECNKRNPLPPCAEGKIIKNGCCYVAPKTKPKCNKRNPLPPCVDGKIVKNGCCYVAPKTKNIQKKTVLKQTKAKATFNKKLNQFDLLDIRNKRHGVYDNKQDCIKDSLSPKKQPITNHKFTHSPHIFDQLYYHAGDWHDIEKYGLLKIRLDHGTSKEFKDYDESSMSKLYYNYDFDATYNCIDYVFNHLKKGIFIVIRNNKVSVFLPFSKASFKNHPRTLKYLYTNNKDKDNISKFYNMKRSKDNKYDILKKNTQNSIKQLQKHTNTLLEWDREKWQLNNCLIRAKKSHNVEGDHSTNIFKDLFDQVCQTHKIPDVEFILNVRDFPLLKTDLTEPYDHIFDNQTLVLPKKYTNIPFCPIFSQCITKDFEDILIPTKDDWTRVSGKFYTDDWNDGCKDLHEDVKPILWSDKIEKVVFRGKVTGCGHTIKDNIRLKAALLGFENPDLLDVGIVDWNAGIKKPKYHPVSIINPKNFPFGLKEYMPVANKYKYKYILNLDGNVSAYRLGEELGSGSVIFIPQSKYVLWFSHKLIPWKHYIPIDNDLGNLLEMVQWCKENDTQCQQIAQNAKSFYNTNFSKKAILKHVEQSLKNIHSQRCVQFYSPPKLTSKPDICVVTIFREDATKERHIQKDHFIRIMKKLFEPISNITIIVVEQNDSAAFNIGKLKNIGFDLAKKYNVSGHFIFSDIDMIPNTRLMKYYLVAPECPLALAQRGTRYTKDYWVPSKTHPPFLGGVTGFSKNDFEKINGYPNNFMGWGGEDDALRMRIRNANLEISFPEKGAIIDLETYTIQEKKNIIVNNLKENQKWEKLHQDEQKWKNNGLNTLDYTLISSTKNKNIIHCVVDIEHDKNVKAHPELYTFNQMNYKPKKNLLWRVKKV